MNALQHRNRHARIASRSSRRGFSLTEMLFAIFILGTGLAMSAALFPAAARQNQSSLAETVGTIICKNGLALAGSVLTDANVPLTPPATSVPYSYSVLADENTEGILTASNQHYPVGRVDGDVPAGGKVQGFVLLGRRTGASTAQGFQFVAVSYAREKNAVKTHKVTLKRFQINVVAPNPTAIPPTPYRLYPVTTSNGQYIKMNSPVIIDQGAANTSVVYAMIQSTAMIQLRMNGFPDRDIGTGLKYAYFVVDDTGGGTLADFSPAMNVMNIRTWLRPPGM